MKIDVFSPEQSQEIIRFFTDVFSNSEGQKEGRVIGSLVTDLINETDSKQLLGYVGSLEGEVIGCIFFSCLKLLSGKNAYILSPVAISSEMQGKGLGQQLINFGIQQLKDRGVDLVFTYGDSDFYSKVGFVKITEDAVKAPWALTYPEGWLAQSLNDEGITKEIGVAQCVDALNKKEYW